MIVLVPVHCFSLLSSEADTLTVSSFNTATGSETRTHSLEDTERCVLSEAGSMAVSFNGADSSIETCDRPVFEALLN